MPSAASRSDSRFSIDYLTVGRLEYLNVIGGGHLWLEEGAGQQGFIHASAMEQVET